jgi:hypothetical protein
VLELVLEPEVEVEPEPEVVPEPEPEPEPDVVVGVLTEVEPVVTVAEGAVVVVEGVQLAEMSVSPAGTSDEGEVPGAASTVSVLVPPVGSPTVSVHVSADALGIAASPLVMRTSPIVTTSIFSLRALDTLVYLLPPSPVLTWTAPHPGGGVDRKLTGAQEVCNAEPSCEWRVSCST